LAQSLSTTSCEPATARSRLVRKSQRGRNRRDPHGSPYFPCPLARK
jgi:hypothetical protein